jgi:HK97 gp10 family phage protein
VSPSLRVHGLEWPLARGTLSKGVRQAHRAFESMAELTDRSVQVRRQIQARLIAGLNAGNQSLMSDAKDQAPIGKTRQLYNGIGIVKPATENDPVAVGASRAPYSRFVNRGTIKMDARPFFTAAWIKMKSGFGSFFK